MRTFQEWLKEKNEVSKLGAAGAGFVLGGPLGAAVGYQMGQGGASQSTGSASKPHDPNAPWWKRDLMQYVPGTDAHGKAQFHKTQQQKQAEQKELIAKGMKPQDAEHYVNYKDTPDFATSALGLSYFKQNYPNLV